MLAMAEQGGTVNQHRARAWQVLTQAIEYHEAMRVYVAVRVVPVGQRSGSYATWLTVCKVPDGLTAYSRAANDLPHLVPALADMLRDVLAVHVLLGP